MTTPSSALPPAAMPDMLESKYRFAYRIRVENLSPRKVNEVQHQEEKEVGGIENDEQSESPEPIDVHHVQLIGRHWNVQELEKDEIESAAAYQNTPGVDSAENAQNTFAREPLIVDAPYTGAGRLSGHLKAPWWWICSVP